MKAALLVILMATSLLSCHRNGSGKDPEPPWDFNLKVSEEDYRGAPGNFDGGWNIIQCKIQRAKIIRDCDGYLTLTQTDTVTMSGFLFLDGESIDISFPKLKISQNSLVDEDKNKVRGRIGRMALNANVPGTGNFTTKFYELENPTIMFSYSKGSVSVIGMAVRD